MGGPGGEPGAGKRPADFLRMGVRSHGDDNPAGGAKAKAKAKAKPARVLDAGT